MKDRFELVSNYQPQGDQPKAIDQLVKGINEGRKHQTLLGATGTGKTFTMSQRDRRGQQTDSRHRPQQNVSRTACTASLKNFSPTTQSNILSAIMTITSRKPTCPRRIHISKKMPASTMRLINCGTRRRLLLFERKDVIIVASVSCIYGLGSPEEYREMVLSLRVGMEIERNEIAAASSLTSNMQRNDIDFHARNIPGARRCRGDFSGFQG